MNKSSELEKKIRQEICCGNWATNSKIPTEEELCAMYGVSRTTVRTALTALRSEGMLISRPRIGTCVSGKKSQPGILHFIVNSMTHSIDGAFAKHFLQLSESYPFLQFQIHDCYKNSARETELIENALRNQNSMVLTNIVSNDRTRTLLKENADRCIVIGVAPELSGLCAQINLDVETGANMMMQHILARGHKRIAFIGSYFDGFRYLTWRNSLLAAGLTPDDDMKLLLEDQIPVSAYDTIKVSADFVKKILNLPKPPTVIYCVSDQWATAVTQAICSLGLEIPENISVTGFDGIYADPADGMTQTLTTIVTPFREIFQIAIEKLMAPDKKYLRTLIRPVLNLGSTLKDLSKS